MRTGVVYGHIQVTLLDAKTGKVRLGPPPETLKKLGYPPMTLDKFDFMQGSKLGRITDWLYPGTPHGYFIIMYNNIAYINK